MIETIDATQNKSNLTPDTKPAYRGWNFLLTWVGLLAGVFLLLYIYINISGFTTIDIFQASESDVKSFAFIVLNLLSLIILGGMIGSSVGLVQWLALKRQFHNWILYSALGVAAVLVINWSISYAKFSVSVNSLGINEAARAQYNAEMELQSGIQDALVSIFPKISDEALNFISTSITGPLYIGALFGLSVGILQWLILMRHFRRSGWWILASILGWGLGNVAAYLLVYLVPDWIPDIVGQSQWQYILAYELCGALGMGLVLGFITGGTMIWLSMKPQLVEQDIDNIPVFTPSAETVSPDPEAAFPDPAEAPPSPPEEA